MAPAQLSSRRIAPSILSADFARLGAQVAEVLEAGARVIHVDVMDGHFVPPLTMGPMVVGALRELASAHDALVDVHLMVERPEGHIPDFARAGADIITVHQEATPHVHYALGQVREAGCASGLALCPATPLPDLAELAEVLDLVLCMTVNPGWGGQAFIASSPGRIARIRQAAPDSVVVEVDGGLDEQTAPRCAEAGAGVFVAGSAVFGTDDPVAAYRRIAAAAGAE